MKTNYEVRYAAHPEDAKSYDTARIRRDFLIEKVFAADEVNMVYSMYDRMVVGGAMPVNEALKLEAIDPLKADFFAIASSEISCEYQEGSIKWYVDGHCYYETSDWFSAWPRKEKVPYPAPFDQPFHIILNLAVGGEWYCRKGRGACASIPGPRRPRGWACSADRKNSGPHPG